VNARRILLEMFDAALRAVDGRACVARQLRAAGIESPVEVFAIGKAASAMACGARDVLGTRIRGMFIVTKDGHSDPDLAGSGVVQVESSHPMPDARSLEHGEELLRRVSALPDSVLPLFLVSGGSSSLVEALHDAVPLEELRALNARGLAAGWDIRRLNAERMKLSRLKGGGITRALGARPALALFISDVPGDDPGVIGSGLLGRSGGEPDAIERHVVADIGAAVRAAREAGAAQGLEIAARDTRIEGDAERRAAEFVAALRATSADGLVWGGECTVMLPEQHGRGGRNTHLALAAALALRAHEPLHILAAGTDGTDGPTSDAGALVDAETVGRAELAGCDVERALRAFDSGSALELAEDLLHTGPTGTNVGDLLIGIRNSPGRRVAS
jgi:hydroxypyruvate reductase